MSWKKREVKVGNIGIGGANPIRIQSMTNTPTSDEKKTADQIVRLFDSGCEIARVTVQGKKEAYSCEKIKNYLLQNGCDIPLVADIHFYPPAALIVADFVDKVRINPGNYLANIDDENTRKTRLQEGLFPLIDKLKKQKKALRIGVNHGSLSSYVLEKFGNTTEAMVFSALEYTEIIRGFDFHDIVYSMKASNPIVMIEAYRKLETKLRSLNYDYPIHLGVTEAGFGIDGKIKSALGIGALLFEGIGDTIRVSLTEDPCNEIKPAKSIIDYFEKNPRCDRKELSYQKTPKDKTDVILYNPSNIDISSEVDGVFFDKDVSEEFLESFDMKGLKVFNGSKFSNFAEITSDDEKEIQNIIEKNPSYVFLSLDKDRINKSKNILAYLQKEKVTFPVILSFSYKGDIDSVAINSSIEFGTLFLDNLFDGIMIKASIPTEEKENISLSILQSCRRRIYKTDFISCPGCGRTLYDIQKVSKIIKQKTSHLPGVKIAVMGCIVNGPGEMADADFGYVGSKKGKIDLYFRKEPVEKNIDEDKAVDRLINLIKEKGFWKDLKIT